MHRNRECRDIDEGSGQLMSLDSTKEYWYYISIGSVCLRMI